jgi:hypothetical protein
MSLLDILRTGVKIADGVTKPLQATVSYWRYIGSDGYGTKTYSPPATSAGIQLKAIVDWKQKQVRTASGVLSVSRASLTFLNILAVVVATSGEGIGDEDLIILPDGTTGPILDMAGFIDAGTGHPIATEVFLG